MKIHASGKTILEPPSNLKRRQLKPERFIDEVYRSGRERHTQKKFVPAAMNFSLETSSRWKQPLSRPQSKAGRALWRSPSTLRLNRSNVKRKPSARGRTR